MIYNITLNVKFGNFSVYLICYLNFSLEPVIFTSTMTISDPREYLASENKRESKEKYKENGKKNTGMCTFVTYNCLHVRVSFLHQFYCKIIRNSPCIFERRGEFDMSMRKN